MTGELFINGLDAYKNWGISLDQSALSALMTPAPKKDFIYSKFRKRNGKVVIHSDARSKFDERDFNLTLVLSAKSESDFIAKYKSFCTQLAKGWLEIKVKYMPDIFRCEYKSCTQFSQFCRGIASFNLKLTEPNPNNRGETDNPKA